MFFGFLRVCEVANAQKNAESKFVIQRSDVTFKDNEALVTIKHSKTDQQGKSVTLVFSPSMS